MDRIVPAGMAGSSEARVADGDGSPSPPGTARPATWWAWWFAGCLLGVGVAVRVLVVIGFPRPFFFYGDSFGYLAAATYLHPAFTRPLGYALFLRGVLILHELSAVVVIQHGLGVVTALVVFVMLRRLGVGVVLATLGMAPLLLDGYQLNLEHYLLAETMFELLIVLAMVALTWNSRPAAWQCALAGGLLAAATLTRTVGIALIAVAAVYLVVRRAGIRRVVLSVLAFCVPVAGYAGWFDHQYGEMNLTGRAGWWLYGRVAPFASCQGLSLPPDERTLCQATPPASRPGPNFYNWSTRSPAARLSRALSAGKHPNGRIMQMLRVDPLLGDFADRVIEHQPLTYLGVIANDLWNYAQPGHPPVNGGEPPQIWQFGWAITHHPTGRAGLAQQRMGEMPQADQPVAGWIADYQRNVYTPGPLVALMLILGVLGAAIGTDPARGHARSAAMLLAACGVLLLITAAATSMFDYRYLVPALALLPAAGVTGIHLLRGRVATVGSRFPMTMHFRPTSGDRVTG